jgi:hypothetical protein
MRWPKTSRVEFQGQAGGILGGECVFIHSAVVDANDLMLQAACGG